MDWKEGGDSRHKFQCKRLIEIKARYVDRSKIEEQMARFGVLSNRWRGRTQQCIKGLTKGIQDCVDKPRGKIREARPPRQFH